jgi:uncharacterized protein (TIGR02588 family)
MKKKNGLEWIVFAVSALLIAGVIAILGKEAMEGGQTPPSLRVEIGAPMSDNGSFRVPVKVQNLGDETAEQAVIEVELVQNGTVLESADLTIAYVPKRSVREGWVVFRRDPRCCTISSRAAAYAKP